ncbi:acyl-CoA N-acyltransferase [Cutaneotrichosporon oleaginosum]|uniref:Acyl-CoA N-acyltransferase n=1 Tax=Cutaneotrichosporon oleaginosum TaxID=879819 RepID=A0A0J0XTF6_9TREE|nr:acyl-CoA N-acyltransferase [Cutaneotrichosporon oleaginosum]KLT44355.1 acyl-CoA N-acyltransferase [Cutaneotrichosporon oleaginosum]TXT07919.1 hypothetical protein COLE_04843 [Cutaneotrichosporon oleaginosum]
MRILAQVDHDRRTALHTRLRASNTAASPALARLRDSADDEEVPLHVWALGGEESDTAPDMRNLQLAETAAHAPSKGGLIDPTQAPPKPPAAPTSNPTTVPELLGQHAPGAAAQPTLPPLAGADDLLGGLVGHTWARWLHITYLFVLPAERGAGLGRTLLQHAERLARDRGCVAAIVQTWDFQAPEFYIANGYEVAGKVEGYPPGITDFTLVKRFNDGEKATVRLGVTDV